MKLSEYNILEEERRRAWNDRGKKKKRKRNKSKKNRSLRRKMILQELVTEQNNICALCHQPFIGIAGTQATIDHIQPKSKGGISDRSNYQAAHRNCNGLKADKV